MVDLFKSVNWNDGEDIVFGDLNDGQRYLSARLYDQIIENLIGSVALTSTDMALNAQRGANAPTHLAYTLHPGSAYLIQGSANNKIKIAAGTLFQKIGNQTGNEPTLLAYAFDGTTELAIANGDATNPRVDIVQMALAYVTDDSQSRDFQDAVTGASSSQPLNKKRQVGITISIKQGAPAASPTYPDPDAGFVCVAGIVVGATYSGAAGLIFGEDTAGAVAVVHDQRMPINVQGSHANVITAVNHSNWTITAGAGSIAPSSGANEVFLGCPRASGRIVGVSPMLGVSTITIHLSRQNGSSTAGGTPTKLNQLGAFTIATVPILMQIPYYTFEAVHEPSAGPTILPSATNKIGPPVWADGSRCARPRSSTVAMGIVGRAGIHAINAASGSAVVGCIFYIAEGI